MAAAAPISPPTGQSLVPPPPSIYYIYNMNSATLSHHFSSFHICSANLPFPPPPTDSVGDVLRSVVFRTVLGTTIQGPSTPSSLTHCRSALPLYFPTSFGRLFIPYMLLGHCLLWERTWREMPTWKSMRGMDDLRGEEVESNCLIGEPDRMQPTWEAWHKKMG